jgi:HD superfamily phosphodiesterase
MKLSSLANIVNQAFNYVINTSRQFNIDESHALKHSMDVFHTTNKIYNSEVKKFPILETQREIIYSAAILHDMCDKKYMDQEKGIENMRNYMCDFMNETDLEMSSKIISTMSYSTVKKNGYPDLKEYQLAYNIVREADLLTAYDVDRCIIYGMMVEKMSYNDSVKRAFELFETRILKYRSDNLFTTEHALCESILLHHKSLIDIKYLHKLF